MRRHPAPGSGLSSHSRHRQALAACAVAIHTPVAQLAEQRSPKPQVGGSSPSWRATPAVPSRKSGQIGNQSRMNSKIESSKEAASSGGDIAKYVISAVLLLAGLFVWFWFSSADRALAFGSWTPQLRALAVVVGLVAGAFVFVGTAKGRAARNFLVESRFELRKVVWPTRQESIRTTWVVILAVIILSLLLGGFDFLIQKTTQWFLAR